MPKIGQNILISQKNQLGPIFQPKTGDKPKKVIFCFHGSPLKYRSNGTIPEIRRFDALHAVCRRVNDIHTEVPKIVELLMDKKKDWNYDDLTKANDCNHEIVKGRGNQSRIIFFVR